MTGSSGGLAHALIGDRYELLGELAHGGMGVVLLVLDRSTGKRVALKRSIGKDEATRALNASLLEREYRTLVSLRHPRIIRLDDYGVDDSGPFYTMELLDGEDLRLRSPMPWREVCFHLRDVASSLALLHSRRLVHRDVTPANIRLTGEGRAKLLDFGALTSFGRCTIVAGTPPVVSPEALDATDIDHRADLFALGATAYYALTGRHAYAAGSLRELPAVWGRGSPVRPSDLVSDVPEALDALILSLLSLDRESRPSSAAEVIDRLEVIADLAPEKDDQVLYSYLAGQALIARERPMAKFNSRLRRASSGTGHTLLVEATAGLGKTALLDRFARDARVAGAAVLTVNARAHQHPFGACLALARQALRELGEAAAAAASQHGLGSLARGGGGSPPVDRPSDPKQVDRQLPLEQAFEGFFLTLTAENALVLLVDDLHAADGHSLNAFILIAKAALRHRLLLVGALDVDDPATDGAALTLLHRLSGRSRLRPFRIEDTENLVGSIFGEVSSTKQLAAWLQRQTDGNPSLSIELVTHLIDKQHVRYADGTWVLPHAFPEENVSAVAAAATAGRMRRLSAHARRLAECLTPHPRSPDTRTCGALCDPEISSTPQDLARLLAELVRGGVLIGDSDGYAFSQPRMRHALYAELPEARRRELHRRLATILAEDAGTDPERCFEVGYHLLRAGAEAEARDRVNQSVFWVATRPDGVVRALPQLKELYRHYQRVGSADERLSIAAPIVVAAYYVDPTLQDDLGDATALAFQRRAGFHLASRLLFLGSYLAILIGTSCALARALWAWVRNPGGRAFGVVPVGLEGALSAFVGVFHSFAGVCASRSAVAYLRLEPSTHAFLLSLLAPARGLHRHNALRLVHDLIAIAIAEVDGDIAKAHDGYHDQLARLPHVRLFTDESRHHVEAGLLCSLGRVCLFRMGDAALGCADRVDALGGEHDRILAQFIRRSYHLYRGETAKATEAEQVLDAMAAHYGYRWVPDVLTVLDLVPYHLSGDVVGLKRVIHRTQQVLRVAPSYVLYRDVVQAMYEGHRGHPERSLATYEQLADRLQPFRHPVWSFAQAHRAECLNALGRHQEALELCEEALKRVGASARVYVLAYQQFERERALALAHLGETVQAAHQLEELLALHKGDCHPLILGLLHRDRARVARLAGDDEAFLGHSHAAWAQFASTGNVTLLAQAQRLAKLSGSPTISGPVEKATPDEAAPMRSITGAAPRILGPKALEYILQLSGASRGYLYRIEKGRPILLARQGDDDGADLEVRVTEWLAALDNESTKTMPVSGGESQEDAAHRSAEPTFLPLSVIRHGDPYTVGVAVVFESQTLDGVQARHLRDLAVALHTSEITSSQKSPTAMAPSS